MPILLMKLVTTKIATAPMPFFVRPIAKKIAGTLNSTFVAPNLARHVGFLAAELATRAWLAGPEMTVADIQMSYPLEALAAAPAAAISCRIGCARSSRASKRGPRTSAPSSAAARASCPARSAYGAPRRSRSCATRSDHADRRDAEHGARDREWQRGREMRREHRRRHELRDGGRLAERTRAQPTVCAAQPVRDHDRHLHELMAAHAILISRPRPPRVVRVRDDRAERRDDEQLVAQRIDPIAGPGRVDGDARSPPRVTRDAAIERIADRRGRDDRDRPCQRSVRDPQRRAERDAQNARQIREPHDHSVAPVTRRAPHVRLPRARS